MWNICNRRQWRGLLPASFAGLLLLAATQAPAALQWGSPFSDHAVLQRDRPIHIWGQADPAADIQIRLGTATAIAHADAQGHWQATLPSLPAGGPFILSAQAGPDHLEAHDIYLGDVWLCAGQSNMQLSTAEDLRAQTLLQQANPQPRLHLLMIPKHPATTPQTKFQADWQPSSASTAAHFSDVGLQFGLDLLADPALKNVPIGLIDSSFGGTAIEAWASGPTLAAEFHSSDLMNSMFNIQPGQLFNSMIAPLGPIGLKGVVWYQGENNAPRAGLYPKLFAAMGHDWRQQFDDPSLWFLIVQLPRFNDLYGGYPFTWMREAQQKITTTVPHTALAVTLDTSDGFDLHPRDKGEVARRVSLLARHLVYGEDIVCQGPSLKSTTTQGDSMVLTFDTNDGPLVANHPNQVQGFELAGDDGVYHPASARIANDTVIVQSPLVPQPKTVRYAWGANPPADLFNTAGLPAAPFRTDTAPIAFSPELLPTPPQHRIATGTYEAIINGDSIISSLIAAGQQFLSNENANDGGCNFPSFFGPRRILHCKQLADNTIAFDDLGVTATFQFNVDSMTFRLANHGKDATPYRINLDPSVEVKRLSDGQVELHRGKATIDIIGIDPAKVAVPTTGGPLEATVPGNGQRAITLSVHVRL